MKTKLERYTDKAAFIEDLLEFEELPTVVQVLLNEYKDILRNDSRNTPRETTRESILDGAKKCVLTDRNKLYGAPEDSFRVIADLWTCYLRGRGHYAGAAQNRPRIHRKDTKRGHLHRYSGLRRLCRRDRMQR